MASTVRRAAAHLAVAVAAGLVALTAGCGGSSSGKVAQLGSTTTGSHGSSGATAASTQGSGWLAFSGCMRTHGVARYPDPGTSGIPPKATLQQLGVSSAGFQSAQSACRHLLPNGGRPPNEAERRRVAVQSLQFSRCVRSHGVPNFPDPDVTGRIPDPGSVGVDQGSPKFQAANEACGAYRPPYMPSNSAYDTWARTHTGG